MNPRPAANPLLLHTATPTLCEAGARVIATEAAAVAALRGLAHYAVSRSH